MNYGLKGIFPIGFELQLPFVFLYIIIKKQEMDCEDSIGIVIRIWRWNFEFALYTTRERKYNKKRFPLLHFCLTFPFSKISIDRMHEVETVDEYCQIYIHTYIKVKFFKWNFRIPFYKIKA